MIRMPAIGDDFGRYRLLRLLGQGGMGMVYAARDAALDREVALKIINPTYAADEEFRARFKQEALALSRMDSPHVVQVHDHGELDGCLFLVTQLVPGGDLMRAIRRANAGPDGPGLPPAAALDILLQVLDGIADAHRSGVVHRDVKPSNVLLRERGGRTDAFVCDFGIATTPGGEDGHTLSRTGSAIGSFPYMAPERHQGAVAGIASDVYALGCLLWHTLTGAVPYAGTDVEIALAHLQAPVPQLPGDDPFSRGVNEVLARSMAKDPGQRYASATAMRTALAGLVPLAPGAVDLPESTSLRQALPLAGVPGLPPPYDPTRGSAATSAGRRRRRAVARAVAGAVAVALLVVGGVWVGTLVGGGGAPVETAAGVPSDAGSVVVEPGLRLSREIAPTDLGGVLPYGDPSGAGDSSGAGGAEGADDGVVGAGPQDGTATSTRTPGSRPSSRPSRTTGTSSAPEPSRSPTRTRTPTRAPTTTTPTSSAPAQPRPTWECWNGARVVQRSSCPALSGVAAVKYVFPSAQDCRTVGVGSPRRYGVECVVATGSGKATVRYLQWASVKQASATIGEGYGSARQGWRLGWTWVNTGGGERPWRRAYLRDKVPFSVQVTAPNQTARQKAVERLSFRADDRLYGRPL